MDALVNYGSDDESSDKCQENKVISCKWCGVHTTSRGSTKKVDTGSHSSRNEMKTSGRSLSETIEDVNYDNVQMDMSEESDAGQRPKAGRSSSSCPSSSSEAEEEALHVKPCVPTGLNSQDSKRVVRHKDAGSSRHRRREESRRSPGHKEKQKKKDRSGKRSRSRDRSEKSKESKEKRRRENSREKGDGESKESYRKDCRSRSRERSRYRHHSERRRSRSRSPHHHRHHHRHHDDERRSKRSRGRSSSRNHSPEGNRTAEAKKATAVSRAVAAAAANINAALAATEAITKNESNSELEEEGGYSANGKGAQQATPSEGVGSQSESSSTPKAAVGGIAASLLSPQLLVQRSLEVQATHLHNATGIQFPAYYNPAAMNPLKYAEQMQKRKKLWSHKEASKESSNTGTSGSTNNWESTTFAQDQDGRLSAKFKRLMGIKTPGAATAPAAGQPASTSQPAEDVIKKQEELFSTMERQYEAARLATHTLRGVGLGFGSSSSYQYPR